MTGFFGKIRESVSGAPAKVPRYMLTDDGEERLTRVEVARGREHDLLFAVKELQPLATARTVSKKLIWPMDRVEGGLKVLESEGLVERT